MKKTIISVAMALTFLSIIIPVGTTSITPYHHGVNG